MFHRCRLLLQGGYASGTCSGLVIPSPAIREVTQACVQDSWSCAAWKRLGRKVVAIILVVCREASRNMKDGLSPHTYGSLCIQAQTVTQAACSDE